MAPVLSWRNGRKQLLRVTRALTATVAAMTSLCCIEAVCSPTVEPTSGDAGSAASTSTSPSDSAKQQDLAANSQAVAWLNDLQAGRKQARAQKKHLLVVVSAEWCPDCRRLENSILPVADVQKFLKDNYVCVKLDADQAPGKKMKAAHHVKAIPTLFVFTPHGQFITSGNAEHVDPQSFIALLQGMTHRRS